MQPRTFRLATAASGVWTCTAPIGRSRAIALTYGTEQNGTYLCVEDSDVLMVRSIL